MPPVEVGAMARARPELSKKRIKYKFLCAQILDIPLFVFFSEICTRFSAEKKWSFHRKLC